MSEASRNKPSLLSAEPYILDGNHRWLSHIIYKTPMPAWQLSLPFGDALKMLFAFPKAYAYGDGGYHPVTR